MSSTPTKRRGNGFLFESDKIDEYQNDPRMQNVLNGYILINKEDFLRWVTPTHSEKNLTKKIKDSNSRMVKSLFSKICDSRIGEAYTKASFSHVFPKYNEEIQKARMIFDTGRYKDHKFDWLAAVHPDYLKRTSIDEKADAVENFLITELGECRKLRNTISVNLICSAKVNAEVKGYHLLGAMMYCIKSSKYEKSAVLELAGRFRNVSGFYSYSTVGFERDETLFGNDCFSDPNNLPMRVKLGRGISLDTIIDHASGNVVPNVNDETNLFENKQYFIKNKKVPAVQKEQLTLVEFAELLYDFDIDNKANLRNNMYYNNIVQGAKNKTEKRNRIIEQIKINTPNNTQVSTAAPSATRVSRSSRKRAREEQDRLDAKAKKAKATVVSASKKLEQAMRKQEEAAEAARQKAEEVQQLFTASLSASPGRRRRTSRNSASRNSASRNSASRNSASSRSRSRGRVGSKD
jgi:hypothetical protein